MRRLASHLVVAVIASTFSASATADPEPPYPLDTVPRDAPATGDLDCPKVDLVMYRGSVLHYSPEVWVNPAFRARLGAFERIVRDTGIEIYGRAPDRVAHLGAFGCRRMRDHTSFLSEHAFGNALDVEGFDFGHLPKDAKLPAGLPPTFANGFEVRVLRHWGKKVGHAAVHARFLRTLALRLIARDDVFRVLLGPGYPGHSNHFHFDMSTFRLVQIFEDGHLLQPPPPPPKP